MSDDILEDWKKSRFVVVESAFIDIADGNLIILTDIVYWNEHYDELGDWCEKNGAEVCGMTVICSDPVLTVFLLRWS